MTAYPSAPAFFSDRELPDCEKSIFAALNPPSVMTEIRQAASLDFPDTDALRYLPEGPYPLSDSRFSWVGIQHGPAARVGSLNLYDLETKSNRSFELPGRPGFAFPCTDEATFVVGCERSLGCFDVENNDWNPFCDSVDQDVENTIINDGMVYQDNLIFGTKDLEFQTKKAGLYLWRGRDQRLIQLRDDQICSNGKAMRTTGNGQLQLVDIDSPTRQVVGYPIDIERGQLGDPEVLLDLTDDPGVPDGAILAPDGNGLLVSIFLPEAASCGETRLYDLASGECQMIWQTAGSPQNTCPALVRHDGKLQLVITTAAEHMDSDKRKACPNAGRLFIAETEFEAPVEPLAPRFQR